MKQTRHGDEDRRRIVGEWRQSGLGIMAFCSGREIPYRSFKRWQAEQDGGVQAASEFLPVIIQPATMAGMASCRIRIGES